MRFRGKAALWANGNNKRRIGSLMLAAAAIGGSASALGQSSSYDTSRILEYGGLECTGVAHCKTVEAGRHKIDVGQSLILTFECPTRAPHFVGWDTEQNDDIQVTVLPRPPVHTADGNVASGSDGRLNVLAQNVGSAIGHVTMFLGCSTTMAEPVGMMRRRTGISANHTTFLDGN
jgi:hypothetical protein